MMDRAPESSRRCAPLFEPLFDPLVALLALLLGWGLVSWRSGPPAPLPVDAPLEAFSGERAFATLQRVLGGESEAARPHPSGSPEHTRVLEAIEAELAALGLASERHETLLHRGGTVARIRNLLARVPGSASGSEPRSEPVVLLVAHTDSVRAGPGAADDGAGVATLLETARAVLAGPPLARDVVLLFTDGEENGLHGADAFLREHPLAGELGLVLNFEARGTGGASMLFQTSGPNRWLMDTAAASLARPWTSSVADLVYNTMPNDTDLSEFIERGVPGINFAFIDGLARYHTPLDDLEHLDRGSLQHHGDGALALTRAFADRSLVRGEHGVPAGAPRGSAVFFDVLGAFVVVWPLGWSLPLAVAVLLLGLAARARARRREPREPRDPPSARPSWQTVLVTFGRPLRGLLVATVFGSLPGVLARMDSGLDFPALARPGALGAATWAGVLFGLSLWPSSPDGPGGEERSARRRELDGAWWWFMLLGLTSAWLLPAVCYLFLVPAGAAALAGLAWPDRPHVREALSILAAAITWLPIAHGLRLGFGYAQPALIALPLAAVALWLRPALQAPWPRVPVRAALTATVVAGTVLAVARPRDAHSPGWVTLVHGSVPGRASVELHGSQLPSFLNQGLAGVEFQDNSGSWEADAPAWDAPAPSAELLERRPDDTVVVRLRSRRGASELTLTLPEAVRLLRVRHPDEPEASAGAERWLDTSGSAGGHWWLLGVPPEGLVVELAAPDPVRLQLADVSSQLPPYLQELVDARPEHLVQRSRGDRSVVRTSVEL